MNIGQIRYFVAVYQAGSFSKAAKNQLITVQAVSKSISDLEDEIGRELFERKSRGVEPTPFGTAFYRKAAEALRCFNDLESFALGQADPAAPKVQLALTASRIGAPVDVVLMSGYEALDQLRKGEVDAFITIGRFDTPYTDCAVILDTPTAVSMHAQHPLASRTSVTLDELADYPVIVDPDLDYFNESILASYVRRGLRSERFAPKSPEDMIEHFFGRQGYAFSVAQAALADDRFGSVIVPIDPQDAVEVPICFISPKHAKNPLYLKAERVLAGVQPSDF